MADAPCSRSTAAIGRAVGDEVSHQPAVSALRGIAPVGSVASAGGARQSSAAAAATTAFAAAPVRHPVPSLWRFVDPRSAQLIHLVASGSDYRYSVSDCRQNRLDCGRESGAESSQQGLI